MPLSGYRILIVEDEALIALDLSHALEDLHAIVVGSVNNVADARKLVSEQKIDCAVLDVQLGGESVAALIPELDARRIPRVFMTAFPERNLPKAWTVWPVLEKPMVRGDLLRAIERVIQNHSAGLRPDREIWSAVSVMVQRYKAAAMLEAAARADKLLEEGDPVARGDLAPHPERD